MKIAAPQHRIPRAEQTFRGVIFEAINSGFARHQEEDESIPAVSEMKSPKCRIATVKNAFKKYKEAKSWRIKENKKRDFGWMKKVLD